MATSSAQPMMIVVRQDSPYKSVQDIIADARKRPGEVSYATLGINSLHHIIGETVQDITGIKLNHVPYVGGAQYMVDLLTGRVDFAMSTTGSMAGFPGQVRALALAQNAPSQLDPKIPTSVQAGLPALDLPSWVGLAVPKGTPQPIIDKINVALKQVDENPKFREEMNKLGAEAYFVTGQEFEPKIKEGSDRIGALLTKLGLAQN
jgi:tripartite-type tricarboxylate transporter receptor subunit TctC